MKQVIETPEAREERLEARVRRLSLRPGSRRATPRFAVEVDVTVDGDHDFYTGLSENLSTGGVFVATHGLKPMGSIIELSLYLPDFDRTLRGTGEVRWVREFNENSDVPPGMGIRFLALEDGALELITQFLMGRGALLYEE